MIAAVKLCESYQRQPGRHYTSVIPTNLYGPIDNFDLAGSRVLPALLRKAHEAKARGDAAYVVCGSGTMRREFLYIDDLAAGCVHLMESGNNGPLLNVGTGLQVTIGELAKTVMEEVVGFNGQIVYDHSQPDSTPLKLLNGSRMAALGWRARTCLREGIERAHAAASFRPEVRPFPSERRA